MAAQRHGEGLAHEEASSSGRGPVAAGGVPQAPQEAAASYAAWARSTAWQAWLAVDGAVAWLFGLDTPKYEWALDRYNRQQAEAALRARAFDGELSSMAPHAAPPVNLMRADAENPRLPCSAPPRQ